MYEAGKREAISSEVEKLMEAKFVGEVAYPESLANLVLVQKNLNQAYPKDFAWY